MSNQLFEGEQLKLRALNDSDIPTILKWYENADFLNFFSAEAAIPKQAHEFKKWTEASNSNEFRFAVRLKETDELIGMIEIDGVLWNHRTAWISMAIGDKENWSKGYGTEMLTLALRYAFSELNLYRLQLTVFEFNERAVALYEKLGFKQEGTYREFLEREGKRYDMFLYGLLRHEYHAR
ncbi:GNAT family N-acetyltransferase [Chengkuizengella axinellae]|uniref:GNAT family protein n=1 Tax=Chengkuizengella axinellae TaxID=3064388 RepID=A0ABT9IUA9_9BACL|nr:GNAT family protein [Chengkuizengella sp. 2205SS18-9]MDP5272949.1 GNAT family protein [Chengkuizengella sp. 2205SS18-9]